MSRIKSDNLVEIFRSHLPDGNTWLTCSRVDGGGYFLKFLDQFEFVVSPIGDVVSDSGVPDSGYDTATHLQINHVNALAQSLKGKLLLHGAAIESAAVDGAFAFVGASGSGKSTLAAHFALAGDKYLADDSFEVCSANGLHYAYPGHASIRLWPDSEAALALDGLPNKAITTTALSQKRRISHEHVLRHATAPKHLVAIFLVSPTRCSEPKLEAVSEVDAFKALTAQSFIIDPANPQIAQPLFEKLATLAASGLVRKFSFPHSYSELPRTREFILSNL